MSAAAPAVLGKNRGHCFQSGRVAAAGWPAKWAMQDTAAALLYRAGHTGAKQFSRCHRSQTQPGGTVRIMADGGRAWYRDLKTCGSVWVCPICAEKISRERAADVQAGIDSALAHGKGVTLVTLTFRHSELDTLKNSLNQFSRASRMLKSGREYAALRAELGLIGEVRALEVTHGARGWHPHSHAVTFSRAPILDNRPSYPRHGENPTVGIVVPVAGHRLVQLKRKIFSLWYRAMARERRAPRRPRLFGSLAEKKAYRARLRKIGLPSYKNGVDVRPAKYAAEYIAKWGFAAELTRPHLKKGHKGGRTPFQLLADATNGDARAAALWRDFAIQFHGKKQLFWSKEKTASGWVSVRDVLGIGAELTEQQALALADEKGVEIASVEGDDWLIIRRFRARAAILEAALSGRLADELEALRARSREKYGSDGQGNRRAFLALVDAAA